MADDGYSDSNPSAGPSYTDQKSKTKRALGAAGASLNSSGVSTLNDVRDEASSRVQSLTGYKRQRDRSQNWTSESSQRGARNSAEQGEAAGEDIAVAKDSGFQHQGFEEAQILTEVVTMKATRKKKGKWMQKAKKSMEDRGTVGKFGKATSKKIARGKSEGGVQKKEAVFAENMKNLAKKRKKKRGKGRGMKSSGR